MEEYRQSVVAAGRVVSACFLRAFSSCFIISTFSSRGTEFSFPCRLLLWPSRISRDLINTIFIALKLCRETWWWRGTWSTTPSTGRWRCQGSPRLWCRRLTCKGWDSYISSAFSIAFIRVRTALGSYILSGKLSLHLYQIRRTNLILKLLIESLVISKVQLTDKLLLGDQRLIKSFDTINFLLLAGFRYCCFSVIWIIF